jgi:hypothetical protein
MIETWEHGKWYPTMYHSELFVGLPRLVSAYEKYEDRARSVRFEDLARGDEAVVAGLMNYLGIEFDPQVLQRFAQVTLSGRMGDLKGTAQYSALSTEPLDKWKRTIVNPVRIAWCRRYIRFLGEERLAVMGYSRDQLMEDLGSQPVRANGVAGDLGRLIVDIAKEPVRVRIRRQGLGGPNVVRKLLRP